MAEILKQSTVDARPELNAFHAASSEARIAPVAIGAALLGLLGALGIIGAAWEFRSIVELFAGLDESWLVWIAFGTILGAATLFAWIALDAIGLWLAHLKLRNSPQTQAVTKSVASVVRHLVRIRVVAGLLMLVGVAPFAMPFKDSYPTNGAVLALWSGNRQLWVVAGLLTWILGCGWVLMLARRAVWDLWLAGGARMDSEVGEAFAVVVPGFEAYQPTPESPARPMAPIPVVSLDSAAKLPLPVLPLTDEVSSFQPMPAVVPPSPDNTDRIAKVDPGEGRRERQFWRCEQLIFGLLLLCLIVCIFRLPLTIPISRDYFKTETWRLVQRHFEVQGLAPPAFPMSWSATPPLVDPRRGYAGLAITALSLGVWGIQLVGIGWIFRCLLIGPRYGQAAILAAWAVLAMLILRAALAQYAVQGRHNMPPETGLGFGVGFAFSRHSVSFAWTLVECILPILIILVLRLEVSRTLFRFRPKQQSRNR